MNINEIIYRKIAGQTSAEEDARLKEWMEASPLHQSQYEQLQNDPDFSANYQIYQRLDVDKAWAKLIEKEKIGSELEVSGEKSEVRSEKLEVREMRNLLKYAAAILVLIVAGAGYWYSQYTKVTPPEIPEAVQLAMQQSIQSGKQEAESEELRVKSEESFGSEELRESEELRVKSEESHGKMNKEDGLLSEGEKSPAKNFSHSFNNSSSLFTLHSSLNITSSLTKDQLLAAKRITTKHDKEFWLTLEDGTLVHLNYNTRLIYPEKFGRGNRNVILDGEAYFMVAKDKSRPFIVHTPNGDVRVYGTEFNVNTRTEVRGKKIRGERSASGAENTSLSTAVVLVKGSVSVTPAGGKETMLKPGQQATVNGQSSMVNGQWSTVNVESVDVEPYVAWNEGKFSFRNRQLVHIMDVLSRWYNVSVEYEDKKLQDIQISGSLSKYEEMEPTLETLEAVAGIQIAIHNNHLYIKKINL